MDELKTDEQNLDDDPKDGAAAAGGSPGGPDDDGVATIGADVLKAKPDVSPHVVEKQRQTLNIPHGPEIQAAGAAPGEPVKGQTDKYGNRFDPELHKVNEDGTPKIVKKTGFIAMRQGVRWKQKTITTPAADSQQVEQMTQPMSVRAAAANATGMVIALGYMVYKEKGEARPHEFQMMENGFTRIFEERGITQVPAWAEASMAVSAYFISRAAEPTARRNAAGFFRKTWGGIKRFARRVFTRQPRHQKYREQAPESPDIEPEREAA